MHRDTLLVPFILVVFLGCIMHTFRALREGLELMNRVGVAPPQFTAFMWRNVVLLAFVKVYATNKVLIGFNAKYIHKCR